MDSEHNKKIRLLVGINDFRVGGAQKLVLDILNNIDSEKFSVSLVSFAQYADTQSFYGQLSSNIQVHKLHFKGFKDISSWLQLYKIIAKEKPDVVWSHLFFSNTVFRILRLRFWSTHMVVNEHNMYINRMLPFRLVNAALARLTDTIVAVSTSVRDFTAKNEWIPKHKFQVIHNGVDVARFKSVPTAAMASVREELKLKPEQKIIISVGQLIRQKNHALLIDAFSFFVRQHPEYVLVIVGDGTLRTKLQNQINDLSLTESVTLLGIRHDLPALCHASECLVMSSRFEGFGIVAIEAMAAGLPVISTKVAGPDEYIKDGENGFFAEQNPESIAKKITQLHSMDREERESMSTEAQKTAANYAIASVTEQYQKLFDTLVSRK